MGHAIEEIAIQRGHNIVCKVGIENLEDRAAEIKQFIPEFEISYTPDYRQAIANSWPQSIDDSTARNDWGWKPEYDLSKMTADMMENLR